MEETFYRKFVEFAGFNTNHEFLLNSSYFNLSKETLPVFLIIIIITNTPLKSPHTVHRFLSKRRKEREGGGNSSNPGPDTHACTSEESEEGQCSSTKSSSSEAAAEENRHRKWNEPERRARGGWKSVGGASKRGSLSLWWGLSRGACGRGADPSSSPQSTSSRRDACVFSFAGFTDLTRLACPPPSLPPHSLPRTHSVATRLSRSVVFRPPVRSSE